MKHWKSTGKGRRIIGMVLLFIFVAFSNKMFATGGLIKKVLHEQTSTFDCDEDQPSDTGSDICVPSEYAMVIAWQELIVYSVRSAHSSVLMGSRPPKWIMNKQLKLGSIR